ncbi:Brefeldin A resistance protein [Psilocybe cubensis]|uniref:ABC transporter domain-containing protein n=2 Tax=Psilocybe cubensis TaxID=181762 RepID=A0A8H8CM34_PSICU|nr:Brefeldin A resistance protein [Psilocybe cubensis]KAH9484099.1 Brefeldin A resistance protein [Psilocybe cubensis]
MADSPAPPPLSDIKEETASGTLSRSASQPTLYALDSVPNPANAPTHGDQHHACPPVVAKPKMRPRGNSSVSHVDLEFFDPSGVQELRHTMTHENVNQPSGKPGSRASTDSSEATLNIGAGDQPFDFEKTLKRVIRKREEADIKPRTLGVVFRDLKVVGKAASDSFQPTLGSLFNPVVILEQIQKARHPTLRNILTGFEGVVKPGEMLLVLGSPGSGCSTLLKTLANQTDEYYAVSGERHYDSITPTELANHFRGDVQYCPEDDVHFPTLSVQQTIEFAAKSRTPRSRVGSTTRKEFADFVTNMLATIFGLRHTLTTPVGDAAIRGVSGGEKKRVSISEALASRGCIGAWDNSTRGLDASTALEFVRALRIATDTFDSTTIVSIYQAGESLYEYFDKVCVIYEGRMIYYGAASEAKAYFLEMGYEPANRQTTPDFLVAVTDPNARIPRRDYTPPRPLPRTAAEFAEYFLQSSRGKTNKGEIQAYLDEQVGKQEKKEAYMQSAYAEFAKRSPKSNPYLLSIPQQVAIVMKRRWQIILGNPLATGLNLFSFVFQGIIIGSVYLNSAEATSAYFSRGGVLFFALLFSALATMAEIPALYSQRPIVLRHQKAALYHPFVEALALTLVDVPISLVTSVVFSIILYFMVGLQRTASQFFIFLLFLFTMTIAMKGWFRGIAAAFPSEAAAQSFAGISVLALSIYTGYTIPKPTMIGALRWITYINPLKYGFEAIMTNEFSTLNGTCSVLVPHGPGYENITLANQVCATVGAVPGEATVDGNNFVLLSYGFKHSNLWMNFGIVIAFLVGFVGAYLLFTEVNTKSAAVRATVLYRRGAIIKKSTRAENVQDEEMMDVLDEKPPNTPISPKSFEASHTPAAVTAEEKSDGVIRHSDVFSWRNINYTVPIPGKEDRLLLSNVSGYVAPGKLTALMGESGAGKTTLLNVLAMRTDTGVVTGDRFVNGQSLPADFQSQSAYCQQMDTHMPLQTVREALLFSAKLRQPTSVPLAEKEAYVEKCLTMCGLEEYAEATVGSLSIEHRKRTTIGVELAAKPKLLLFLDEPTSGLDSQSAWAIMDFLRTLADNGQAILCTIHQPSAELFQVFDRMLLLKKGGKTVYFGNIGHNATTLIEYFEKNGGRKCLPHENPAEYMLDVIGAGATATSDLDWYEIWKKSQEAVKLQEEIDAIHTEGRNRPAVTTEIHNEFATPWGYQVKELFKRNASSFWRDPDYLMAKLVLNAIGGLFIGFTFFQAKDSQQGTQNKLFSIFMATILSVPLANQLQVPFINTRTIYEIRERPSRMYSWTALITSQIMIEVPWNVFGSIILFFCWYWTVGFETSRAGYTFLMLVIAFPLYFTTFGQAVGAMAPSAEIAALLFSFLFSFVITFNGVVQPFSQLGWWKWMYRLSPYTYLIEGLLGQALGHQEINCSPVEFVKVNPPDGQTCEAFLTAYISMAGGYVANPQATSACEFCSMRTTDQFLGAAFNIFYDNHWRNFGIFMAFSVFNIFLIYILTYLFRIHKGPLLPSLRRKTSTN